MRLHLQPSSVTLLASANDTYNWAHRSGASWPCSTLSGKRFAASFDSNGLNDLSVNGRDAGDIDAHELSACISDLLARRLPKDHPCYFVVVGQFLSAPLAQSQEGK